VSAEPVAPDAVVPEGGASLKVVSGPSLEAGAEIVLIDARITLGSDPAKASVVLANDIKVSRLHAFIQREGDVYMLYDAESVSGTLVNGQAITRGHPLLPGDQVRIGDTVMTFSLRRAWTSKPASAKGVAGEVVAIAAVLALVAVSLLLFRTGDNARLEMSGYNVDVAKPLVPRDARGYVDWKSNSFVEDLEMDVDRARLHYRRGMRCHDDMALDPANAFTAILELRRAKAYRWKLPDTADVGFQIDRVDRAIEDCQKYLQHQKEKYVKGFMHASGTNDRRKKIECLRRLANMFRDRFSDARSEERSTYEMALAKLESGA